MIRNRYFHIGLAHLGSTVCLRGFILSRSIEARLFEFKLAVILVVTDGSGFDFSLG